MKLIEIPEKTLKDLIRHAEVVAGGLKTPASSRVADAARLLKKDIKKIEKIISNINDEKFHRKQIAAELREVVPPAISQTHSVCDPERRQAERDRGGDNGR
jgi:hypothetical protein